MTYGPTHQFCPNCNAMLPSYLESCPRCGQDMSRPASGFSKRDAAQFVGIVLLVAAVPLAIVILTAVICVAVVR